MNTIKILTLIGAPALILSACGTNTPALQQSSYDATSRKTQIDAQCQNFFDGCNTCTRMQDGQAACTLMYCEQYEAPKCLDQEINAELGNPEEISADGEAISWALLPNLGENSAWDPAQITAYLGRSLAEVQAELEASGGMLRVAIRDGEPQILTADYHPERLNVEVWSGVIVNAFFG